MSHHLLSNKAFTKFLKDHDPNEKYEYFANGNCVIAQYFKSRGFEEPDVGGYDYALIEDGKRNELPENWNRVAAGGAGFCSGWTFGEAYQRAVDLELV